VQEKMADQKLLSGGESDNEDVGQCTKCCYRLGCDCCSGGHDMGELLQVRENKDRACTDMLMCFIFLIAIIGEIYIACWCAQVKGADPQGLLMAYDYEGNKCEGDTPYVVWPDVESWNFRVCASDCSETKPGGSIPMVTCGDGTQGYESELWLDLYCFPTADVVIDQISGNGLDSFNTALGDLYKAQYAVASSIGIALVVCFAYIGWLRCCGECFIWTCLALVGVGGAFIGAALIYKANDVKDSIGSQGADAMYWTGVIALILDLLFIITMCCLRKRIELAVELVGEASRALGALVWLIFFPFLHLVLLIGFFTFWIIVLMYIFSVNKETQEDIPSDPSSIQTCVIPKSLADLYGTGTFLDEDWDQSVVENVLWYHIFMGFWFYEFLHYWGYMVKAGAYAEWYFSPWVDDGNFDKKEMNTSTPILNNVWRVTRYHLGTIAFGSLIIAIINTIRAALMYALGKTEDSEWSIAKCIYSCLQCILSCIECCIDKINKDGFIFTIIYGMPFCPASVKAFDMNMAHLADVGAVTIVSSIFIRMGKVVITVVTTGVLLFAIQYLGIFDDHALSSLMLPFAAISIISWGIASVFLDIFETGIETIFVCYIAEIDNGGNKKFAHPDLTGIFDRNSEDSAVVATKMNSIRGGRAAPNDMMAS